jgi:hypothetical protein
MMSVIGGKAEISRVKPVRAEPFDQLGSTTHVVNRFTGATCGRNLPS